VRLLRTPLMATVFNQGTLKEGTLKEGAFKEGAFNLPASRFTLCS
jgi:hypothetical protein